MKLSRAWVFAICAITGMVIFLGLVLLAPSADSDRPAVTRKTTDPVPAEPPKFPGHAEITLFPETAEEAKEIQEKLIPSECEDGNGGEKPGICPSESNE